MKPLEKYTENKFAARVKQMGCECIKLNVRNDSHWPDRLVIKPDNVAFFVEFKREGEIPRPAQEAKMRDLRKRGNRVYVIDNIMMIDSILRLENLL